MTLRVIANGSEDVQYKEAAAAAVIIPGQLVKLNSSAQAILNNVSGLGPVAVAVENDLFGRGLDDTWNVGDQVIYAYVDAGDEIQAVIPAGTPAIVFDDYLTPDALGNLIKGVQATAVARARQAVDNSAGGTYARCRAVILS
jgi:hypothetical protein